MRLFYFIRITIYDCNDQETAEACVEEVFDTCYKDTDPFTHYP